MTNDKSFEVTLPRGRRLTVRVLDDADASTWAAYADDRLEPVGVARLVTRSLGEPAEATVTIEAEYQQLGLGKILFDTLVLSALELGFERVVVRVGPDSWIGDKLLHRRGALTRARTSTELTLEVPIVDGPRTLVTSRPLPTLTRGVRPIVS